MRACSLRHVAVCLGLGLLFVAPGCSCEDDPNNVGGDPVCGNSDVERGEQCDDGNTDDGDGCSASCQNETTDGVCGDGIVDTGEQCDDGNTDDGDGCSATCATETNPMCGDGVLDPGEECDDGNMVALDGCEDDCTETPYEVMCDDIPPLASGVCEVTGSGMPTLIIGDILAPGTIMRGGQVRVTPNGMIECVGCDCAQGGETTITCPEGIVSPGLINAHDHITFIQNNPYSDSGERYEHRHDWRRGLNGHTEINAAGSASTNAKHWGELRFMIGGATSTIGSGEVDGFLRNLDRMAQRDLGEPPVEYDTFPLGDSNGAQLTNSCNYPNPVSNADIAGQDAYFPHIAEGINAVARNEFVCVAAEGDGDLLEPQSAFIHSIGLTPLDYARMADQGTTLVWSPRSNITLYGDTALVQVAHRLGVRIALGTDWMPTGSMNLQRELTCVSDWNADYLDGYFEDIEIWKMVTTNAAEAASMDDAIGLLQQGLVADIAIFDGSSNADYRAVIDAAPEDTALVIRGGTALYGDANIMDAVSPNCDTVDVCGSDKRLCTADETGADFATLQAANAGIYPLFFCDNMPTTEPSCHPERPVSVDGGDIYDGVSTAADPDGDGRPDAMDNCPNTFNPIRPVDENQQADFDNDMLGDSCDPCPLDADNTNCGGFDPMDVDLDGVLNTDDNCPEDANPNQEDGDMDMRGDACDGCPMFSNPAPEACPESIYDIKQGNVGGTVAVLNALVTGCADGNGFFLQRKVGDPDYAGTDYSGVYVYHPTVVCDTTLSIGDRVTLNPTSVSTFFSQIQLINATITVDASNNEQLPDPVVVVDPSTVAGTSPTPLEGVLAQVNNVLVTDDMPAPGPGDVAPTNEFEVTGGLRINDLMFQVNPLPAINQPFASITGILNFRNDNQKLEPRDINDVVDGMPILVGFGPQPAFVREAQMGVATIPQPLTVTLSGNVMMDTDVAVTSIDPMSLDVVNQLVTIASGTNSAPVIFDAFAQSAGVSVTASLDTVMMNATVRVVGAGEVPAVTAITPPNASVAPMGMLAMEVFLDIPADPMMGEVVTLGLSPDTFGSVPPSVMIAADQLSAGFMFTAFGNPGQETLSATLNGVVMTTVNVVQGGGLVINEVDYDQIGADNDEFIELLNASGAPLDLSFIEVVLVNGNNDMPYASYPLAPAGMLAPGEYLVLGSTTALAMVPMGVKTITLNAASNNVQNGSPDGIAVIDTSAMTLHDALSYEGDITMAMLSIGTTTLVEGMGLMMGVEDSNAAVGSLARIPDGTDTDEASMDWAFTSTITPGVANVP